MTIYYALVRSALDYGSMIYGSASISQLQSLDRVQSRALRLCSGALKSSPVVSLQVELGEMPLSLRRKKLSLAYWVNLGGHGKELLSQSILESCWEYTVKKGQGFGWNIGSWVQETGLRGELIAPAVPISPVPPWLLPQPVVDLSVLEYVQEEAEPEFLTEFVKSYIRDTYDSCMEIYTDGSKDPDTGRTGASMVVRGIGVSFFWRLTDEVSVYSTETVAIVKALEWLEETRPEKVVICSDSAAALNSIQSSRSCRMDLLYEVYMHLHQLERMGVAVTFLWIPAHVGVWGNERADRLAKKALTRSEPEISVHLGRGEMKVLIQREIMKQWQAQWDLERKGRHLHSIQRQVGKGARVGSNRRDEVVMARLRIGHTLLNDTQFRVGRRVSGNCSWCVDEAETIKHVLFECPKFLSERAEWIAELQSDSDTGIELNLVTVLRVGSVGKLMKYLKTTGLYARI